MNKIKFPFDMKPMKSILLIVLAFGSLLYSCTKLDSPYVTVKSRTIVDTIMDWDSVNPIRRVLLEDYTGHKCVNCPEAAVLAHNLEDVNGGRLIVLAVHAGTWAIPSTSGDFTADYTSPASETWNIALGVNSSDPSGMVNRKDFGSGKVLLKDSWSSAVNQVINLAPDAFIVITNKFNQANGVLSSTVYTKFLNPLQGTYKLILCIAEDSLHSAQKNKNIDVGTVPTIYNYNFMHVMRGAINGAWGEALTTSVNTTHTYLDRFTYTLKSTWVAKNCWLYAIVYRDDTKEIVQVHRKKMF